MLYLICDWGRIFGGSVDKWLATTTDTLDEVERDDATPRPGNLVSLVEAMGLEPTNLLTASQALYQLSYAPSGGSER